MSESNDWINLQVGLLPKAMNALEDAAALEGHNVEDTVNRALQMYCFMVAERRAGARVFVGRSRWRSKEMIWG
ncbi:hypothetical protein I0C86_41315 [Plantactinospora sp. S1510]|uniref:Uncharacterized protein n=1 Tax=Plantactinospora alkalitolerans TaxID=2789879 RepID=A0ABS0HAS0_9ACTN|nr:hypothetical protein [Plantactinospora alkalitolerans]MBF9135293.1 hypothetical protein [Plantactinospora alkalitolerans]